MPATRALRAAAFAAVLAAMAGMTAGCTVRPLYSNAPLTPGGETARAVLASVFVKPATTRYGQEVRNQLIFLLSGGAGQPGAPAYDVDLGVTSLRENSATTQITTAVNEPTAATIVMTSSYVITERASGKAVAQGKRSFASQYDVPRQEFAALRAQRDAENRAARELAEILRSAIAEELSRHGSAPS